MCDEVIFRDRYLHTIEDLQSALGGGEIVPNRQCGYADDDLLPHCCLCPVDLAQTAAKNGLRLWPSSEGEGVWILSDILSDILTTPELSRAAGVGLERTVRRLGG